MVWTIVLGIVFLGALASLIWLIWKKWHQLKIVDPDTSPLSQSRRLKYEIMRKRVERAGEKHFKKVQSGVFKPVGQGVQNTFRKIAGKLTAVERRYQEKKRETNGYDQTTLATLLEEGKRLMDQEAWERAEKKFIEVISHDAKNVEAYEYLGRLYQHKKDYDLARKTFLFLKKLSPDDPSVITSLGEISMERGEKKRAFNYFKKAATLSPKNPKYLDFLIRSAIDQKDLHEAQGALDRLTEVNPDNKKIAAYELEIKELRQSLLGSPEKESKPVKKEKE